MPTEMMGRATKAVCSVYGVTLCGYPDCACASPIFAARAAIHAIRPNLDTMDGAVMNAMCAAFGWPTNAGNFPGDDGLTAACARAVDAYLDAALGDGK